MKNIQVLKKKLLKLSSSSRNRELIDSSTGKKGLRKIVSKIEELELLKDLDLKNSKDEEIKKELITFKEKNFSQKVLDLVNFEYFLNSLGEDFNKNELYKKMREISNKEYIKLYSKIDPEKVTMGNIIAKIQLPFISTMIYFKFDNLFSFLLIDSPILRNEQLMTIYQFLFMIVFVINWVRFFQNIDLDASPKLKISFEEHLEEVKLKSLKNKT